MNRWASHRVVLGLAAMAATLLGTGPVAAADPTTFVVRSTGNGGDVNLGDDICDADPGPGQFRCTLRAAIEEANVDVDEDRIGFKIGGAGATGVKTITVPDPGLPEITAPLIIDGYTQPDSDPNTAALGTNARLRVVLDGPTTATGVHGLTATARLVVRGLVIRDFANGIRTMGAYSVIAGNFIGTNAAGTAARPNDYGIEVLEADHVRVGGSARADRNLISGNEESQVYFYQADALRIMGNLIGVTASGGADVGSANAGIEGEESSADSVIGGDTAAKANVIAHAGEDGIILYDPGQSVRMLRNSIYANGGLAIDLDDDGVTQNDGYPDADTDPNGLQNFPELISARNVGGVTRIRGRLLTAPERTYRLELFSNPGGSDEAQTYIGAKTVTTEVMGFVQWTFTSASRVRAGRAITATATDLSARQTSEVSAPRTVVDS